VSTSGSLNCVLHNNIIIIRPSLSNKGGLKAIQRARPELIVMSHFTSFFSPQAISSPRDHHSPMAGVATSLSFIWGFMAIGSEVDAANMDLLDTEGVTHILNLTTTSSSRAALDTRVCLRIPLFDSQSEDLLKLLPQALDFIRE
jgi:hypothetical protein